MNKVILMGRLTRDPEVRYSAGENSTCIARYTLAVDRRFARGNTDDGNNADFIPCVAFGKSGEFAEKYLKKGTKIAVTGRIQTGSYTNKDGNKVYTTEVVIEEQEFAESRNTQNGGGQSGGYSGNNYAQNGGRSGETSSRAGTAAHRHRVKTRAADPTREQAGSRTETPPRAVTGTVADSSMGIRSRDSIRMADSMVELPGDSTNRVV